MIVRYENKTRNEYQKKYFQKHKKEIVKYRLKHKKKISKQQKEYYLKNKVKLNQYDYDYRLKNKLEILKHHKRYRLENKEKISKQVKKYYLKNKNKISKQHKKYQLENKEKLNKNQRKAGRKFKCQVMNRYGGHCINCKEKQIQFLTVDHTNNDGAEHRKKIGKTTIYGWLVKNNFPKGFQILCYNCNWVKWIKYLNKLKNTILKSSYKHGYYKKNKKKVFDHYGRKCMCCGFDDERVLTMDHINGGGGKHRREINGSIYGWLIRNGFPKGFKTLCRNCNSGKRELRICPHKNRVLTTPLSL